MRPHAQHVRSARRTKFCGYADRGIIPSPYTGLLRAFKLSRYVHGNERWPSVDADLPKSPACSCGVLRGSCSGAAATVPTSPCTFPLFSICFYRYRRYRRRGRVVEGTPLLRGCSFTRSTSLRRDTPSARAASFMPTGGTIQLGAALFILARLALPRTEPLPVGTPHTSLANARHSETVPQAEPSLHDLRRTRHTDCESNCRSR